MTASTRAGVMIWLAGVLVVLQAGAGAAEAGWVVARVRKRVVVGRILIFF